MKTAMAGENWSECGSAGTSSYFPNRLEAVTETNFKEVVEEMPRMMHSCLWPICTLGIQHAGTWQRVLGIPKEKVHLVPFLDVIRSP